MPTDNTKKKTPKGKMRCWECKKLIKGHVTRLNMGEKYDYIICDPCFGATQQCDICYNLTSIGEGAIYNHASDAGEKGDGIVCSDCRLVASSTPPMICIIRKAREANDEGNKIEAIRIVRLMTSYSLLEAKRLVDWFAGDDATSCEALADAWCDEHREPIKDCVRASKHSSKTATAEPAPAPTPVLETVAQRLAWMHSTGLFDERGNFIVPEPEDENR